jgi:hypothetical protein
MHRFGILQTMEGARSGSAECVPYQHCCLRAPLHIFGLCSLSAPPPPALCTAGCPVIAPPPPFPCPAPPRQKGGAGARCGGSAWIHRRQCRADPSKSRALVDLLADCMDLSADRSRLDSYFRRSAPSMASAPSAAALPHEPPGHAAVELAAAAVAAASRRDARQSAVWRVVPATPCSALAAEAAPATAVAVAAAAAAAPAAVVAGVVMPAAVAAGAADQGTAVAPVASCPAAAADAPGEHCDAGGCQQRQQQAQLPPTQGQQGAGGWWPTLIWCAAAGACLAGPGRGQEQEASGEEAPGQLARQPQRRSSSSSSLEQGSWDLSIDLGSEELGEEQPSRLSAGAGAAQAPPRAASWQQELTSPPAASVGRQRGKSGGAGAHARVPDSGASAAVEQAPLGSSGEDAAAAAGEGSGSELVDLSLVDIGEQERILAAIARARVAAAAGQGQSSACKLRQGSLKRFLGVQRK